MSERNALYYIFSVVRIFLYPLALLYGGIIWLRNRLYNVKFFSSIEFSIPVITVGNLSTGGTGKTPHVEYLVRLLQYQFRPATMSRGYKRRTQGFIIADEKANALRIGDEPMQYHIKFPELVVCVAEERMTGIPLLLQKQPQVEVVILDDAYQHRSVKAGLTIMVTDHSHPFYKDHILPFGSLRESRSSYNRADIIIVSKCPPSLQPAEADVIRKAIAPFSHQQVFFTTIRYAPPYDMLTGGAVSLLNKNIVLVCGIARPEPMLAYLKESAADVHTLSYKDHHYFLSADMEEIKSAFDNWEVTDKIIITTEKDAARLHLHTDKLRAWGITIAVLPITVAVLFDEGTRLDHTVVTYVEKTLAEHNSTRYPQE